MRTAFSVQGAWRRTHSGSVSPAAFILRAIGNGATPSGVVRVEGRIAPPPARLYDLGPEAAGRIRQNLDIGAFAQETRLKLRPWSLMQFDGLQGPTDGLLRDWTPPATGLQKHHGYAFQWFALSALTIALYVWFQLLRPRRRSAPSA